MKNKKKNKKILSNVFEISPITFLSDTKKKFDHFYTDLKKTREKEKIKLEKKMKIEKIREKRNEEKLCMNEVVLDVRQNFIFFSDKSWILYKGKGLK